MQDDLIENIRLRLDRPLVLVGLMGSGKTRLGRMLAQSLSIPFVDSDDEVEIAAGLTISEIFERYGEAYFRDGERRVMQRLLKGGPSVISSGGGALLNAQTANAVRSESISIWVKTDPSIIKPRITRTDHRPLLKGKNVDEVLAQMVKDRYPIYEQSAITVEGLGGPAQDLVKEALDKIDTYLRAGSYRSEAAI